MPPIFKSPGSSLKGEAKSAESDLARILCPGPLVQALEGVKEKTLEFVDAEAALTSAITLLGNESSQISKLRRKKF